MNMFDAAVYALTIIAAVTGFKAGFLRSVATILGYLAAMPLAIAIAPHVAGMIGQPAPAGMQDSALLFGIFLMAGILLGALLRAAVDEIAGDSIHVTDRLAGAALGAVRVMLVSITMVLIFDQFIPPGYEPQFLRGSQLRPILSAAGRAGLKSLPPEAMAYIERLKRERRI